MVTTVVGKQLVASGTSRRGNNDSDAGRKQLARLGRCQRSSGLVADARVCANEAAGDAGEFPGTFSNTVK
jgi:hypothetical protein